MNSEELLKPYVSLINNIPSGPRNIILKIALAQTHSSIQDKTKMLAKLSNEYNLRKSDLVEIVAVYIEIIKMFLVINNKEFNEMLSRVGFSKSLIEEMTLVQNREKVTNTIIQCKKMENKNLALLKWRVDISLYNKLLNKNAKYVIIQINLKDGEKCTIEVDMKTLNKLRYNVALMMKELASTKNSLP